MTADVRRGGTPYAPPIRPAVPPRSAGRIGLWIAALALLLGLPMLAASGSAGAQSTTTAPSGEPAAEEAGDTTVQGTVINRKGNRDRGDDEPVEGVEITVAEEGGAEVETATTDEEGTWAVVVPGPGSYTVTLDPDTLPDDVGIAEGENEVTVAPQRQRRGARPRRLGGRKGLRPETGSSSSDQCDWCTATYPGRQPGGAESEGPRRGAVLSP